MRNPQKMAVSLKDEQTSCFVISRSPVRIRATAPRETPENLPISDPDGEAPDASHASEERIGEIFSQRNDDNLHVGFVDISENEPRCERRSRQPGPGAHVALHKSATSAIGSKRVYRRNGHPVQMMGVQYPTSFTVQSLASAYLAEVTPTKAASTQRHDHLYAKEVVAFFGDKLIEELDTCDVDALHRHLVDVPTLANRVVSFVSELCKLAERRRCRAPNSNPTTAIRRYRETERTIFLREEQRAPFLAACRDAVRFGEVAYSPALLTVIMLLGGLRWSEARELQWSEVWHESAIIRLQARGDGRQSNKGGDEVSIPLSDDLITVLREAPRFGKYVAPNRRTMLPYTDIRKAFVRICARAGVSITPHGLRHTFGTGLAEGGSTQAEIGACMRHRSPNTSWRYIHISARHGRDALLRSANRIRGER